MEYYELRELSEEEKNFPLARFYEDYPLMCPPPLQQQILDAGPMDPAQALDVHDWLDLLQEPGTYRKINMGYCMMPDGSGCYCEYTVVPKTDPMQKKWYMDFCSHRSKGMSGKNGNLRYKLWCPVDHWDRGYVDEEDHGKGTYSIGSLDLGKSDSWAYPKEYVHMIDLTACGLDPDRKKKLEDLGCYISAGWEDFENTPGHHMWLHIDRPCPWGGTEMIGYEWLGYYVKDGEIIRDEETPVNEEMLKNILEHNIVEHIHLPQILPDLYEAYHDLPMDAD